MRKIQFVNGEYYHIYNRGVDKRQIFIDEDDYLKFLRNLEDFNNKSFYEERLKVVNNKGFKELSSFLTKLPKLVEIIAFSLIFNHHHFILKQFVENGITEFMHKIGTSHTNYFNKKYKRSGALFQGPFKAVHINTNEYLLWLSAYVNGNIEIHKISRAENYKWSSFKDFLSQRDNKVLSDINIILSQFKNSEDYRNFVEMVIEESKKRKDLENYLLEEVGSEKELSSLKL